jgi:parallel beta-helix repeat protein
MKKRIIILSLLSILLLLSSFSVTVASNKISEISTINSNKISDDLTNPTIDFYVDDDGGADFENIQDAINQSSDGYTIFVYNGTYYENIRINKKITLIGENKNSTIIDGSRRNGYDVILVLADFVIISSFTIQNSGFSFNGIEAGVKILTNSSKIENCIIRDCWDGIYFFDYYEKKVKYNEIRGNIISNIQECDILGIRADNNIISENFFYKGVIILKVSNNNTIYGNGLNGGSIGHLQLDRSKNNTISYNTFKDSSRVALEILDGSDENNIHHNNFNNIKKWGIRLVESDRSYIHHNNFIKCLRKTFFVKSSFNKWHNNYWGRPRILPKIIFGRKGIFLGLVPWFNIDLRPALKPYDI